MVYTSNKGFKSFWFVVLYITFFVISIVYSTQLFTEHHPKLTTWQDVANYDFSLVDQTYEDETLTNTYGISTPEQLAGVFSIDEYIQQNIDKANAVYADNITSIGSSNDVKQINNEYVLLNDVNMSGRSWTPTANFTGTFNGNYHVIQNLSISSSSYAYLGMVQRLRGTIKNLFLKNINVSNNRKTSGQGGAGSVAGECYGNIENVTILSGSIRGPQYYNNDDRKTGGITGALTYGGQVINCVNYASVTRSKFSGGIVGIQYSGTTIQFCYNYGTILNGRNEYPCAGGICGESYGTIKLCVNYGNVTSTITPEGSGDVKAGGIVGHTNQPIDQCANHGTITAGTTSTTTSYSGGIVGYSESTIKNCYNLGNITSRAKEKQAGESYVSRPDNTLTDAEKEFARQINNRVTPNQLKEILYNTLRTYDLLGTGVLHDGILVASGYRFTTPGLIEDVWPDVYSEKCDAFSILRSSYKVIEKEIDAYAGGIVGRSVSDFSNCYNRGEVNGGYKAQRIDTDVYFISNYYVFNSAEKDWHVDIKKQNYSITYAKQYYHNSINGASSENKSKYSNCSSSTTSKGIDNAVFGIINSTESVELRGDNSVMTYQVSDNLTSNKLILLPSARWNYTGPPERIITYIVEGLTQVHNGTEIRTAYLLRFGPNNGDVVYKLRIRRGSRGEIVGLEHDYIAEPKYYTGRPLFDRFARQNPIYSLETTAHFADFYDNPDMTTLLNYMTIIDLSTSGKPTLSNNFNASSISQFDYGDCFAQNDSINNGFPYLKNMYW